MKDIVVIDNFYQNPLAVRNYALNRATYLQSQHLPQEFPGTESKQSFVSKAVIDRIACSIGETVIADPARYSFGVFAKTFKQDARKRVVHVDGSDWTGLVYLSRPEDSIGGTTFYQDKESGFDRVPSEEHLKAMGFQTREDFLERYIKPKSHDEAAWNVSAKVGMKFNRMLLFKAGSMFHAANGYFGTNDENCRLIQLFFFKTRREA